MSNSEPDNSLARSNGVSGGFDTDESKAEAVRTLVRGTSDTLPDAVELDVGELFEILSSPGRRYVLTYLLQSEGFVACSELVDYVADRTEHSMTDEEFRQRVITELTHSDLPRLSESNLVEYNMERQIVGPTDLTPLVRPYLRLALEHQRLLESSDD